jgi:hypothetical protein
LRHPSLLLHAGDVAEAVARPEVPIVHRRQHDSPVRRLVLACVCEEPQPLRHLVPHCGLTSRHRTRWSWGETPTPRPAEPQ